LERDAKNSYLALDTEEEGPMDQLLGQYYRTASSGVFT